MDSILYENKYDLSNDKGIKQACEEIEKEEEEVNVALEALLTRQCHLGGKLRSISQALPNLEIVKEDAVRLSSMITHTSNLAENVSAKVRQLDEARSRVSECQQRVHDLIDLQLCSEGVQTALRNEDYEKGAAHVHRFLSMDPSILRQTAADVSDTSDNEGSKAENKSVSSLAVNQSCVTLYSAAEKLRTAITNRFNEAVNKEDLASVERFFKIFPLLKMHDEGIQKFSAYLCSKIYEKSQKIINAALATSSNDKRASIIFADTFTNLFETIAHTIEVHQPLIETYYGPGRLLSAISVIQKECDRQTNKIMTEFTKVRQFNKILFQINEYNKTVGSSGSMSGKDKLDPKALDVLIGEISVMHSRIEMFFKFIKRRVTSDIEVGINDGEKKVALQNELSNLINKSELNRTAQNLLGDYLLLERYFMEESAQKAIQIDSLEDSQLTTSLIDDMFFIIRKCIRRASSTGSIDGVCAVVNMSSGVLEGTVCGALKKALRNGFPGGYLDLAQAYSAIHTTIQQGRLQSGDTETQKAMFLAHLNNSDVSVEYVETLCQSMLAEIIQKHPSMTESERGKLESCLSGLSGVTVNLKSVTEYGLRLLISSAVKPRLNPWIDAFNQYNHHPSEDDFAAYESEENFVQVLMMNLDNLLSQFKDTLTSNNFDALMTTITIDCNQRWEKHILKSTFNRLGGLIVEREVRTLCSYLGSLSSFSARDRFSRLTQVAALLAIEKPSEAAEWAAGAAWRLSAQEVRQILTLRTDFHLEDIKRLKL